MSRILLVTLVGLPGSGKTTLCLQLSHCSPPGLQFILVSYDDLTPHLDLEARGIESGEWRRWRKLVSDCVEHLILLSLRINSSATLSKDHHQILSKLPELDESSDALVFLLDDNFYYTSMRHPFWVLAKRYGLGFASIVCYCPYSICLERNSRRAKPVCQQTICKMNNRIEWPNPNQNAWEKFSLSLNLSEPISAVFFEEFMLPFLRDALSKPFDCAGDLEKEEVISAGRLINLNSIMHQVDKALRREVHNVMSSRDSTWKAKHSQSVCSFKRIALEAARSSVMHDASVRSLEDYRREALFIFRGALRDASLDET